MTPEGLIPSPLDSVLNETTVINKPFFFGVFFFLSFFFFFFCLLRAASAAVGGSEARLPVAAVASDLHHSSW